MKYISKKSLMFAGMLLSSFCYDAFFTTWASDELEQQTLPWKRLPKKLEDGLNEIHDTWFSNENADLKELDCIGSELIDFTISLAKLTPAAHYLSNPENKKSLNTLAWVINGHWKNEYWNQISVSDRNQIIKLLLIATIKQCKNFLIYPKLYIPLMKNSTNLQEYTDRLHLLYLHFFTGEIKPLLHEWEYLHMILSLEKFESFKVDKATPLLCQKLRHLIDVSWRHSWWCNISSENRRRVLSLYEKSEKDENKDRVILPCFLMLALKHETNPQTIEKYIDYIYSVIMTKESRPYLGPEMGYLALIESLKHLSPFSDTNKTPERKRCLTQLLQLIEGSWRDTYWEKISNEDVNRIFSLLTSLPAKAYKSNKENTYPSFCLSSLARETDIKKSAKYIEHIHHAIFQGSRPDNFVNKLKLMIEPLARFEPFEKQLSTPQGKKCLRQLLQLIKWSWSDNGEGLIDKDNWERLLKLINLLPQEGSDWQQFGIGGYLYISCVKQATTLQELIQYTDRLYQNTASFLLGTSYNPNPDTFLPILEKLYKDTSIENASPETLNCFCQLAYFLASNYNSDKKQECLKKSFEILQTLAEHKNYETDVYAKALEHLFDEYDNEENLQKLLPTTIALLQSPKVNIETRINLAANCLDFSGINDTQKQIAFKVLQETLINRKVEAPDRIQAAVYLNHFGTQEHISLSQKVCATIYIDKAVDLERRFMAAGLVSAGTNKNLKQQAKQFLLKYMTLQPQQGQKLKELKKIHTQAAYTLLYIGGIPQETEDGQSAIKVLMDEDLEELSPYAMHKDLLNKLKQEVTHNPKTWNKVTIDPDQLPLVIDPSKLPKVAHADLLQLFEDAVKEAESTPEKTKKFTLIRSCMAEKITKENKEGVTIQQMRTGLNRPEIKNLFSNKVITDKIINPHAFMIRLFVDMTQKKAGAASSQTELSDQARQIIGFAINCCTCGTGRTDTTTNLFKHITHQLEAHEINFSSLNKDHKEIRSIIQSVNMEFKLEILSGIGPIVTQILNTAREKIKEPPHQAQYLMTLIGHLVGARPQNSLPRLDKDISSADEKIRALSVQQGLDLFYQFFTTEKITQRIQKRLNEKLAKAGTDMALYNKITAALPKDMTELPFDLDEKYQATLNQVGTINLLLNLGNLK